MDNCLSQAGPICVICKSGYGLDDQGKCTKKCDIENCELCASYKNFSGCILCKDGFVGNANEKGVLNCVEETDATKNCMIGVQNVCRACKYDFYMSDDGKCLKSSKYDGSIYGNGAELLSLFTALMMLFFY